MFLNTPVGTKIILGILFIVNFLISGHLSLFAMLFGTKKPTGSLNHTLGNWYYTITLFTFIVTITWIVDGFHKIFG